MCLLSPLTPRAFPVRNLCVQHKMHNYVSTSKLGLAHFLTTVYANDTFGTQQTQATRSTPYKTSNMATATGRRRLVRQGVSRLSAARFTVWPRGASVVGRTKLEVGERAGIVLKRSATAETTAPMISTDTLQHINYAAGPSQCNNQIPFFPIFKFVF